MFLFPMYNNIFYNQGVAITDEKEIESTLKNLGKSSGYAVKAQVQSGGRGLGYFKENGFKGGVHVVNTIDQIREVIPKMYNKTLVTKQTGEGGLKCKALYIVEKVEIKEEKYLSITLDRKSGGPIFLSSAVGGVNIEEISEKNPSAIKFLPIDINKGLDTNVAKEYAKTLGFTGSQIDQAADIFKKLYKFFIEKDALMLEINPLAILKNDTVMVLDSKVYLIFII